jgi:hypothetical protein
LLKDQYITLEEVATVDGTPSVVGQSSAGGNACNSSAFILSFPKGSAARIDGPLDACNPNEVIVEDKQITVRVPPTPQTPGSIWTWSPDSGFSAENPLAFVPQKDGGWAALRSRSVDHPNDLLDYSDLNRLIEARIGTKKESFISVSSGPGSVQYRNNLLIGSACRAHSCDDTELLVVLDIASQQAFVALKDGVAPAQIIPRAEEWPTGARGDLSAFRKKWRR